MNKIDDKYLLHGITIEGSPIDGYRVFTTDTQWFKIYSLDELTNERFEDAIEQQKKYEKIMNQYLII